MVCNHKCGLISYCFSLRLKSPKKGVKSLYRASFLYMDSVQDSELVGTFFGDLSQKKRKTLWEYATFSITFYWTKSTTLVIKLPLLACNLRSKFCKNKILNQKCPNYQLIRNPSSSVKIDSVAFHDLRKVQSVFVFYLCMYLNIFLFLKIWPIFYF